MPLLATSCMFTADNLRSFAPIFGIDSMQRKEKNIVDSRRKNETRKIQVEGKVAIEEKVEETDKVTGLEGSKATAWLC